MKFYRVTMYRNGHMSSFGWAEARHAAHAADIVCRPWGGVESFDEVTASEVQS